ncbi:MAG TPA: isocitrate lyase/phosphoenolpyruvate mutase family protein [Pseudonocardiaceae bacterium]|nr:isocitrate lyase/phosphoenolpyruvate mutase family protein [Pseudonocardiaceae bacterium]
MSRRESSDLRELLGAPAITELPTVCDPLGARTAVAAGFGAVTLPGFAVGAHLPGDALLSLADVARAVGRVADAAGVPVLLDADTGWVPLADLPTAVRGLAAAGAAAIRLSGQHVPAAVPFQDPVEHRRAHTELLRRVEAVAGADVVLTVRCDVDTEGYDTAVERAADLLAAGAEALLVGSTDEPVLARLPAEFPDARLIHATSPARPGHPATYPVDRLAAWGYAGVGNQYHRCYCARLAPHAADRPRATVEQGM